MATPLTPHTPPSDESESSFEYFSASDESTSSYETISDVSSDGSEQIVWGMTSLSVSISSESSALISQAGALRSPTSFSDDDVVVLSRARSPITADELADLMPALTIAPTSSAPPKAASSQGSGSSVKAKTKKAAGAKPASKTKKAASPQSASPTPKSVKKKTKKAKKAAAAARAQSVSPTFSEFSVVDDVSEAGDRPSMYENAVRYISSFLLNPAPKPNSNLTFLQALTVELGLSTDTLPATLTAARALLKGNVFLNVRDYLDKRGQGLEALQAVMKPSRSALIREVKKGKRVPRQVVKDSGLGVLLVTCH